MHEGEPQPTDDRRPVEEDFQTVDDTLTDLEFRLDLPYTPKERATQVENRRLLTAVQEQFPPQTTETYHAALPENEVSPEDVARYLQAVNEMYTHVDRLAKRDHTTKSETSRAEAQNEWDVLRMEYDSYRNQSLGSREFVGAMRHAYVVLLKIKDRFEPSESG